MAGLKDLARLLPPFLRVPVRNVWRRFRGDPEFRVIGLLADRGSTALDVGANHGEYAIRLGKLADRCVAFEPNPALVTLIRDRVSAAGASNVTVEGCALSDQDGEVVFRIPVIDGVEAGALATIEADNRLDGAEVRSYAVPCRRLDSFDLGTVGFMKIDAEGHETSILEGARALIERDRPAVMIEVEERHKAGSVDHVRRFFTDRGYRGFFLLGRRIMPIDVFDLARHQDMSNIEAETVRFDAVYVNNFLFAADERRSRLLNDLARRKRSL